MYPRVRRTERRHFRFVICRGRIYKSISHAPREAPWFWGLEFHEWQGSDGLQYGKVVGVSSV